MTRSTSLSLIMPRCFGRMTGMPTDGPGSRLSTTANSPRPTTGSVLNSANTAGNAEEPGLVREAAGAMAMMAARAHHCQLKPQVSLTLTEHHQLFEQNQAFLFKKYDIWSRSIITICHPESVINFHIEFREILQIQKNLFYHDFDFN